MSDRFFVATRKGLFTIERGGGGWAVTGVHFLGDNVTLVLSDRRDGRVYAALDHGHFGVKLHRSDDGGRQWKEAAAPAYPPKPDGVADVMDPMGNAPIPWALKLIWSLEPAGADRPGGLWCGTVPGGLFRSEDRGASWSLVRPLWDMPERGQWFGGGMDLPGIHSICVHPGDSRRVWLGVSCGGVWATEDGGETWACRATGMRAAYMPPEQAHNPNIQDPHRLVQCRASPDSMWVQHHNGIFRTSDGAASWRELTDVAVSSFGFAVAVHPEKPDTAWFVPGVSDEKRHAVGGQLVVTRTRDGGKRWDVLRRGLPQEHACDVVFRHALDIDERGRRLAFGSTTGGVWISEDEGDSWSGVSARLPPVYCVRFA